MKKKVIAFAGGGTGGHIFPIKNLIENINDEKYKILRFGSKNSLEEKIANELTKNGKNLIFISIYSWKLRRYLTFESVYLNLIDLFKNIIWLFQSLFFILKYQPNFVFSKGGFVALTPCLAGKICFKKIFVHESDTVAWLTNRLIWRFANKVFLWFKSTKIKNSNTLVVWQLLSNMFFKKNEYPKNEKTHLLIAWWSQWAKTIIDTIKKLVETWDLDDFQISILWWTQNSKEKLNAKNIDFYEFLSQKELVEIYKKVDFAITRWSATSLAEQDQFDIKKIIVPLPYTGGNHQYYNAKEYEKKWDILLSQLDKNFEQNLQKEILKLRNQHKTPWNYRTEIDGKNAVLDSIL